MLFVYFVTWLKETSLPEEVGWLYQHALRLIIIHNCDFRPTLSEKLLKYIAIFIIEDIIFSKVWFYICII
jgi:hypothetical protein